MNCPRCNTHIDEHPAGPCMNIWVATDVMGWEWEPFWPEGTNTVGKWHHETEEDYTGNPSPYSQSTAVAWQVLEKLERGGWEWRVEKGNCLLWRPGWVTSNLSAARPCIEGRADGTEHAICRAAIKATA